MHEKNPGYSDYFFLRCRMVSHPLVDEVVVFISENSFGRSFAVQTLRLCIDLMVLTIAHDDLGTKGSDNFLLWVCGVESKVLASTREHIHHLRSVSSR